jgi:hypothetical protein
VRDSFDHYFSGWSLDPEEPADAQTEFASLVAAVGDYLQATPEAAEEWRTFPLDGKKECFFHFARKARDSGALPASARPLLEKLRAEYPRSFA